MTGIVLFGARGRMGVAVEHAALESGEFQIKGRIDRDPDSGATTELKPGELPARGDVVVDFSAPEGTRAACRLCARTGAALVSGTTGLGPEDEREMTELSRAAAVLRASNFSLGVMALRRAVEAALGSVPGDWDVEIVERHHRRKVDAPSGTALTLARDVAERRGLGPNALRHGRQGRTGERPADEIGVHALRGGTWVGDHTVLLAGAGEWLELRHVAQDRSAFAHGVLAAARFVAKAPPGLYHLEDLAGGRANR